MNAHKIISAILEVTMYLWVPILLNVFGLSALTGAPLFFAMCGVVTAAFLFANCVLFASGLLKLDENMSFRGICLGILLGSSVVALVGLAPVAISAYLCSIPMMVPVTTALTGNLFQFMFTSGLHFTSALNFIFWVPRFAFSYAQANNVSTSTLNPSGVSGNQSDDRGTSQLPINSQQEARCSKSIPTASTTGRPADTNLSHIPVARATGTLTATCGPVADTFI